MKSLEHEWKHFLILTSKKSGSSVKTGAFRYEEQDERIILIKSSILLLEGKVPQFIN